MKKLLLMLAAVAMVGTAHAGTSLQWGKANRVPQMGTAHTAPVETPIGGAVNPADTTGFPVQGDGTSIYATDPNRDRDFSVKIPMFNLVNLLPSSTFQMDHAEFVGQYSRGTLMMYWTGAAAADSDSVCIMVKVYGRTSATGAQRYLWAAMSNGNVQDTCFSNAAIGDSAGSGGRCFTPMPTFVVVRSGRPLPVKVTMAVLGNGGTSATRGQLRKVPGYALRYAGSNAIAIPLVDQGGASCPFQYLEIEVTNLGWVRTLSSLSCDFWPRVN